jgi:hypothetical protein
MTRSLAIRDAGRIRDGVHAADIADHLTRRPSLMTEVLALLLESPAGRDALAELGMDARPTACELCRRRGGSIQPAGDGWVWRVPGGRGGRGCSGCPLTRWTTTTATTTATAAGRNGP